MKHPFRDRLAKGPLVADGGMGTVLYARGIPPEHCFDEINLSNPRLVQEVHGEYIRAGAEIIETNTFSANRFKLQEFGLEGSVRAINLRGAKTAREAREVVGEPVFVAGSIGPTGRLFFPLGKLNYSEARDAFREQVDALLEGGIDLVMLETFYDLREILEAIRAVRAACELPIVAQMTFTDEGKTLGGNVPFDIVAALEEARVDVIGANCSVGSQAMLDTVQEMHKWAKTPLVAQPNAGLPALVAGRFVYYTNPDYFASHVRRYLEAGVSILGGCCGTTPAHIRALRTAVDAYRGEQGIASPPRVEAVEERRPKAAEVVSELAEDAFPHTFRHRLGREFLVSVEVDPPKGLNPAKCIQGARFLKERGVDLINIADSPLARAGMSNVALASLIQRMVGIETLLHLSCRDRNLMGMQSTLLGVHSLGIKNVLAITGDPPSLGEYPKSTGVFDVDSIGLVTIISRFNQGVDLSGNSIGRQTQFLIGVGVTPTAKDITKEIDRFWQKLDAGAHFVFTQPLYDIADLSAFLERVKGVKVPVFLGILPLQSHRHAEFLHNEVPGIDIPPWCRDRMKEAGEKGIAAGIAMAREMLEQAKDLVSGVYLMPSFGRYEQCAEVLNGFEPELRVRTSTA